jgi:hypothetical protein
MNKDTKVLISLLEKYSGKKVILKEEFADDASISDEIRSLFGKDYTTFLTGLKNLASDEKALNFLKNSIDQGIGKEDRFHVSETRVEASNLIPTQNEIDITKSLSYPMVDAREVKNMLGGNPVKLGGADILIFNQKYIIDGHHRWSQTYVVNPKAKLLCINLQQSGMHPIDVLKATQMAVAATTASVPTETVSGINIFNCESQQIKEYVQNNISKDVTEVLMDFIKTSEPEPVVDYIVNNCNKLKHYNKPISGAPERGLMPQTNTPRGNLQNVLKVLSNGIPGYTKQQMQEAIVLTRLLEKYTGKRAFFTNK